jgi:hypothetical protein
MTCKPGHVETAVFVEMWAGIAHWGHPYPNCNPYLDCHAGTAGKLSTFSIFLFTNKNIDRF